MNCYRCFFCVVKSILLIDNIKRKRMDEIVDNDSMSIDSRSIRSVRNNIPDSLPSMQKGELEKWRLERNGNHLLPPTRFVIPNLIISVNGQIDEKITMNHVSDKVVYNLLFITEQTKTYPTEGASPVLKAQTVNWLKSFRTQLLSEMMRIAKSNYLVASKEEQWRDLGINASGFKDLCRDTHDKVGERVRNCVMIR